MNENHTYYFIGIKGSGMSALAGILHDEGYHVVGSDVEKHFFTQEGLEKRGITIYPFDENNIQENMNIILGNAFKDDHPEAIRARELGLTIRRYHQFVGDLIKNYISIGCAGAHGKTSTTGLAAHVLSGIEKTSFLIGDGTGHGEEGAKYFVLEADEYRSHFHEYAPNYGIITNIDFDHPDYFRDLDHVMEVFEVYAGQVKEALIVCGDDKQVRKLKPNDKMITYGLGDNNDVQAVNIEKTDEGSTFDVIFKGEKIGNYFVPTFGDHNIQNALSVIIVTHLEGLDVEQVKERLRSYPGVKRRFNEKEVGDWQLIDDYAHHPREIKATIQATRQRYPEKPVVAFFQPHTFSRTEALLSEFAEALREADAVYLGEIFASAREQEGTITIHDLAEAVGDKATVVYENDMSELAQHEGSIMLFMGAGDVIKYQSAFEEIISQ